MRVIAFLLLCGCAWQAAAAEIYQWTDENGKRHFGESIPQRYQEAGGPMTLTPANVLPSKTSAPASAQTGSAPAALPVSTEQRLESTPTDSNDCQEAMRRYQESVACFESFRNQNGSLRSGAAQQCQALPQPTGCDQR